MSQILRLGQMPRWQYGLTTLSGAVCALSGGLYLWAQEWPYLATYLATHSLLVTHGVSAACVLFAMGCASSAHIKAGLRSGKNRRSGYLQCAGLAWLCISGWLLYYGSETIRDFATWGHWVMGFCVVPVFLAHTSNRWWPKTMRYTERPTQTGDRYNATELKTACQSPSPTRCR